MKAKLRVTVAVVHTGSRLVRFACGTNTSGFAALAMAGAARVAAAVAARNERRFMVPPGRFSRDLAQGGAACREMDSAMTAACGSDGLRGAPAAPSVTPIMRFAP